ncbi:MAG: hypothetical protein KDD40_06705, partial [Bdellovibrionales bacterium]|nr:hypothetical protein [Bdellovibrionales bacterium]
MNPSNARDLVIDVNGKNGNHGIDGRSYSTHSGASSGNGSDGGDATHSTPGSNAGNIDITLKDDGTQKAHLLLVGSSNNNSVNKQLNVDFQTKIILNASGGRGGDGGDGGDGQGGCNGYRGKNADRYSRGSDGGPGCNGGNGGDATPGSNGGKGGSITVRLSYEDLYLTPLVNWNVKGGQGGNSSTNGSAGQGGNGGQGGSSYSWTTTREVPSTCSETRSRSVSRSSRNADGSTSYYTDYETYTVSVSCTKTVTDHHYNSGGSTGPRGRGGSSGTGNTSSGSKGQDGSFRFIVKSEDGKEITYTRTFELRLRSYQVIDEDGNGIYEPGETVRIYNIVVENAAQMPTPGKKAKVLISLQNSEWILSEPQLIEIETLKGGEIRQLKGELRFKIRNNRFKISENLAAATDTIAPIAEVTRINYRLNSFQFPKTLSISYPIELQTFSTKERLGPGESAPIVWKVKNLSNKTIGDIQKDTRTMKINLARSGGDAIEDSILFQDSSIKDAKSIEKQDWSLKIPQIPPGHYFLMEGQITVSPSALAYTREHLKSTLSLSDFETGNQEDIEYGSIVVTVGQTYSYTPGAEILIVTNASTTRKQIESLSTFFKSIGIKYDVWDYSYYGFFSLTDDLEIANKQSLLQNYAGRTIVFLTNSSENEYESEKLLRQISYEQFVLAATEFKANLIFVGDEYEKLQGFLNSRVVPLSVHSNKVFDSPNKLIKAIKEQNLSNLHGMGFQIEATANKIDREVLRTAKKAFKILKKFENEGQMFVTYSMNENQSTADKNAKIKGRITFVRALNYLDGRMTIILESPENLNSADYYNSNDFFRQLILGMGFEQKIRMTQLNLSNWDPQKKQFLAEALAADLVEELDTMIKININSQRRLFIDQLTKNNINTPIFDIQVLLEALAKSYFYADILNYSKAKKYKQKIIENGHRFLGMNEAAFLKAIKEKIESLELK